MIERNFSEERVDLAVRRMKGFYGSRTFEPEVLAEQGLIGLCKMTEQTTFVKFVEVCRALESTTKRTEKVAHLVDFLSSLSPDEIVSTVSFITGRPFPESDVRVLDVGGQTLWKLDRTSGQATLILNQLQFLKFTIRSTKLPRLLVRAPGNERRF